MVKVKICGITNLEDAQAALDAGADALGFVFYKKSPRYVSPGCAADIIKGKGLPKRIKKVGVFVNAREGRIRQIARSCGLDMLQFHGNESPEFCARFKGQKVVKAFRIKKRVDLQGILRYKTYAYLFDTFVKEKAGGTGKKFNWQLIRELGLKRPVFLSGGLTERNVLKAIKEISPDWVDVSSSVETRPGKKDYKKVERFIRAAKDKR